ncbi:hypothetical protein RM697_11260 [Ichthyenterobacterium sp. W332]|uniref:SnoaL-like domain-containing protein n=1 Tax=Microcosmobacter mediterraneus TaxID=3075607 RepID=A0ABU2YN32_9FLAO|nr:nuclear transport factor 2 family protein [Ichthyenterobacterium sp. W332]MDT0559232.1 hypothetical protein [Ichthyenterobacterium sp. W332]
MKTIGILTLILGLVSCSNEQTVLEVTTFKLNSNSDVAAFNTLDAEVESAFTSKQKGFISRQSTIDKDGNYTVLVYWKSLEDAKASMDKFMNDESVSDYASMINGASMKMSRYTIDSNFNAEENEFIEVMSFNTKNGTDIENFNVTNKKVETDFTSKQKGFLQRITGVSESGEQIVVVYWDNKANSDAVIQSFMEAPIAKEFMGEMDQSSIKMGRAQTISSLNGKNIVMTNKDKVIALLNSFNTGDQTPISYINPEKYIQHNLSVADGLAGFGEVMQHAPEGGFKANVIRAFEDGDYVFTHTEYDFFGPKAGFDVFRFENGLIVEHWDNLLEVQKPNPSGRTQFDGPTKIADLEKTEANKKVVTDFITNVLLNHEMDKLTTYINPTNYSQHNPAVADGLDGFGAAMKYFADNGLVMEYTKLHKVLGEGNFVLSMSEGNFGKGEHTAFYDLFRLEEGQIVEHWDVISSIPDKEEWKNTNGKF